MRQGTCRLCFPPDECTVVVDLVTVPVGGIALAVESHTYRTRVFLAQGGTVFTSITVQ